MHINKGLCPKQNTVCSALLQAFVVLWIIIPLKVLYDTFRKSVLLMTTVAIKWTAGIILFLTLAHSAAVSKHLDIGQNSDKYESDITMIECWGFGFILTLGLALAELDSLQGA